MTAPGLAVLAEGLSGQQQLALVGVLLGVLVFGAVVLVVERRDVGHEAPPAGLSAMDPPRQVRRGPAVAVPIPSARYALEAQAQPPEPYAVPFVAPDDDGPPAVTPPTQVQP